MFEILDSDWLCDEVTSITTSSERIILGSDFNCPLSKEDKEGGRDFSHKYHVVEEIKSLM